MEATPKKLSKKALLKLMDKFTDKVDSEGYIIESKGLIIPDDVKIIMRRRT